MNLHTITAKTTKRLIKAAECSRISQSAILFSLEIIGVYFQAFGMLTYIHCQVMLFPNTILYWDIQYSLPCPITTPQTTLNLPLLECSLWLLSTCQYHSYIQVQSLHLEYLELHDIINKYSHNKLNGTVNFDKQLWLE